VVTGLVVVASLVLTVLWARRLGGVARASAEPAKGLGRRRFLAGFAAGFGGVFASVAASFARNLGWLTVTAPNIQVKTPTGADSPSPEWAGARIREYRRLGRTNFEVSDISLGSTRIRDEVGEKVARAAIERGVNYFDTAPDYSEAGSERTLGRVLQGYRDQMFLATKFCTPQGNLPAGTSVAHYMEAVEASLDRLQTDYVDLVHIHACDTLERLMDPNVHEAFDRLKQQGKARFLGFSSHTPNLEAVADRAIDSGRFDVMMLAYHHGAWPRLAAIVDRAHAADVGVVAMKTLKGAKHKGLLESRAEQDSYTQAAFKWVLSNPSVSCLVISFRDLANVDEYLYASGGRPTRGDLALLGEYDRRIAGKHCYQHCGACLASCPEGLPIDDVLRFKMYFEDYGDEREAMRQYANLDVRADVCTGCSAPCANACPFDVPIPEMTRRAHQLLTLASNS
jgi:predicted aldo/keto reductase-like oxidoreductase